jgi:zinc protease
MREVPVTAAELAAAHNFLVGVFPLRFETPGPVAGSLAGLFIHDLPDDELAAYRPAIEAVTADDVLRVAREHIHPDRCAIVLVGDHEQIGGDLEAAAIAPVAVVADDAEAPGPNG